MKIGFQMLIAIQTIPISADFRSALQDNQVYALSQIAMQVSLSHRNLHGGWTMISETTETA